MKKTITITVGLQCQEESFPYADVADVVFSGVDAERWIMDYGSSPIIIALKKKLSRYRRNVTFDSRNFQLTKKILEGAKIKVMAKDYGISASRAAGIFYDTLNRLNPTCWKECRWSGQPLKDMRRNKDQFLQWVKDE
jgi:hypothetical protein